MPRCPNCNYELVLLEHRQKYKCAKCGKLFPQKEVEIKEFREWNRRQRQEEKERVEQELKQNKEQKPKLSKEEKLARSREAQRKFREENREEYNQTKREYWASNHNHLLEKRRENYKKKKAQILARQKLYGENHKIERRINNLRFEQKELALERLKFEQIEFYRQFRRTFAHFAAFPSTNIKQKP